MILSNFSSTMAPSGSARGCKLLVWLLVPMLLSIPAMAQNAMKTASKAMTGEATNAVEAPVKAAGVSYKPVNRRDPFLNPTLFVKTEKLDEELDRGLPPPGIAGTYIAQAKFQGASLREDLKLAVVRGADNRAYFLREGDKLFDGYVKTIQLDSITFVRETKLRSGKTLTQDVTQKLRTP